MTWLEHSGLPSLQAVSQDYLSRIAWLAGIPLDMFMSDNAPNVKDLDAKLQGTQLLLCDARPGGLAAHWLEH